MRKLPFLIFLLSAIFGIGSCDGILTMPLHKAFSRETVFYPMLNSENGRFGWSVDISGTTAIIGAPSTTISSNFPEVACIIEKDSLCMWQKPTVLLASNFSGGDFFEVL